MTDIFDPRICDNHRQRFGEKRGLTLINAAQSSLTQYASELQEGFATQNLEQMIRAAHSLKSSAANLGAGQLRAGAESLELRYTQGADLTLLEPVEAVIALVQATLLEVQAYLEVWGQSKNQE